MALVDPVCWYSQSCAVSSLCAEVDLGLFLGEVTEVPLRSGVPCWLLERPAAMLGLSCGGVQDSSWVSVT
jgi:hypothetical protein